MKMKKTFCAAIVGFILGAAVVLLATSMTSKTLTLRPTLAASQRNADTANRPRGDVATKRFPDALIIGVPKCGTRALLTFLMTHPSIKAATQEIHFFEKEENYAKGLDWYRNNFPHALPNQTLIEKTPAYLSCQVCPSRVRLMSPSIKLIAVLCDPVEQLRSQYMQTLRQGKNAQTSFRDWLVDDKTGNLLDPGHRAKQLQFVMYQASLENWLGHFPRRQLHIVDGPKLVENPALEVMAVEKFLGLPRYFKEEHFFFNESKGFYCVKEEGGRQRLICLDEKKGHKDKVYVEPFVLSRLQNFSRRENENLSNLIGRKMSWE